MAFGLGSMLVSDLQDLLFFFFFGLENFYAFSYFQPIQIMAF